MPDALELPRMLGVVVPFVSADVTAVLEQIAVPRGHRFGIAWLRYFGSWRGPSFPAIVGSLDYLTEPVARLGGIDAIWIDWRSLEVKHFPSPKQWAFDLPVHSLSVRGQDERTFLGADENTDIAH